MNEEKHTRWGEMIELELQLMIRLCKDFLKYLSKLNVERPGAFLYSAGNKGQKGPKLFTSGQKFGNLFIYSSEHVLLGQITWHGFHSAEKGF